METNRSKSWAETMHIQVIEGEAVSLLTSKTGSWRSVRPVVNERMAPCANNCPAQNNIPECLALFSENRIEEAWRRLKETNPFPSVTGRVCESFCEQGCNRGNYDESVAVKSLERFLGDYGQKHQLASPTLPPKRHKVAVAGAGPAGLSAAHYLAVLGYRVTVLEASRSAGGLLQWGIPEYRLPKQVVAKEVEVIKRMGVEIRTGTALGKDLDLEGLRAQGYEAVVIATGAQKSVSLNIPGEDTEGVFSSIDFLREANSSKFCPGTNRVVVVGGGNAAIDAARVCVRSGAKDVTILYRRSRAEMPAIAEEIEAAINDGVRIQYLVTPTEVVAENNKVAGVKCVRMELGEAVSTGRRESVPIPGSAYTLEADTVVVAIGQVPDQGLLRRLGLRVSRGVATGVSAGDVSSTPFVFVAGDVRRPERGTVAQAIADGRNVAWKIHSCLSRERPLEPKNGPVVGYEELNTCYFKHKKRLEPATKSQRASNTTAIAEARRCFQCGTCNKCDVCWFFCPDGAVSGTDSKVGFNYDYCKGCGICAKECPRGVIAMEDEDKWL